MKNTMDRLYRFIGAKDNDSIDMAHKEILLLSPKETKVITWRFGIECEAMTLQAIGDRLNLSRERIRQIQMRAMRKLQRRITLNLKAIL